MDLNGNCQYCPQQCSSCTRVNEVVCQGCKAGYWGDTCSMKCYEGCMLDLCHMTEGHCLKGCREGYTDKLCEIPSNRDSVVIGLSVTVGILGIVVITAVVLFIVKRQRGSLCSPRDVLFCLPSAKEAEARQETEGGNPRPIINSLDYVVPTWGPDDPYTSLSGNQGYERPVTSTNH